MTNPNLEALVDELLHGVACRLADTRRRYPHDDYAARIYWCATCEVLDGAIAPADDLVDDYRCICCNNPQVPWSDVGHPVIARPAPPRRARRSRRRRGHR